MKNKRIFLPCLAIISIMCLITAPFFGATFISFKDAFDPGSPSYLIFWRLRLPREIGAFLAGAGLSLCGVVFQAMFRNSLATPFTLGISSGAALGASLFIRLGLPVGLSVMPGCPLAALAGCCIAMLLVYGITRIIGGFSTTVMLLAGVIVNFFFSSLVMFVQYLSNAQDAVQIMRWLMGSVYAVELAMLFELAFVVLPGLWVFWHISAELDLLTAGEELAASRGLSVVRIKMLIFILASFITGIIVSVTGPIGFVGLMIPQICRMWLGYGHYLLVPASFFVGGAFLVICDLLARSILAPAELPIGILTAMCGAPFSLWILYRGIRSGNVE